MSLFVPLLEFDQAVGDDDVFQRQDMADAGIDGKDKPIVSVGGHKVDKERGREMARVRRIAAEIDGGVLDLPPAAGRCAGELKRRRIDGGTDRIARGGKSGCAGAGHGIRREPVHAPAAMARQAQGAGGRGRIQRQLALVNQFGRIPKEGAWLGNAESREEGACWVESKDQVWRVMRKHHLSLARRQSWCVSTDPEFSRKAADVVGLYLNPPENTLVLCVDEKPCIQALERAQGWIRLPNGRALTGFAHEYKRHGTSTLFAALEWPPGWCMQGIIGAGADANFWIS
jgi:hypothetical protein